MKYAVILGDGMADYPQKSLGGKTPLDLAKKPYIDGLCAYSEVGLCKTIADGLRKRGEDFSLLIMPDHPTPLDVMTHVSDPVPYILYNSKIAASCGAEKYCETEAAKTGVFVNSGVSLMKKFLGK